MDIDAMDGSGTTAQFRRVLIVEDDGIIAMALAEAITSAGHIVVGIARTTAKALTMASESLPDMAICDINLADGSSGLDAGERMFEQFEVRSIIVTGSRDIPDRPHWCDGVIQKPYNPALLLRLLAGPPTSTARHQPVQAFIAR